MPQQFTGTLDNGLTILGEKLEGVRSLALGFIVGAGSAYDPDDCNGLSHFTEAMLLEGTTTRSARDISNAFDDLGVRYGTSTDAETVGLSGIMVGSRLPEALPIFADILQHPAFPQEQLDHTRSSILQELRHEEDEPMVQVRNLLRKVYYEGHPYSKRPTGEPDAVRAITRTNLESYYGTYFNPANTICAVAGDFDWDEVRSLMQSAFEGWRGDRKAPEIPAPSPRPQVYTEFKESQQEHIAAASPSVPYGHADYYAAIIAAEVLGGGMSSRLFEEVREKRGLVYSVGATYAPGRHQGIWRLYAGTTAERAPQTYQVLLDELHKIDEGGVTEEEFDRFQRLTRSHMIMSGESTSARLRSLLTSWWYEGRLKTLAYVREQIDSLTLEQVNRVLQRYPMADDLVICALGPSTQEALTGQAVGV